MVPSIRGHQLISGKVESVHTTQMCPACVYAAVLCVLPATTGSYTVYNMGLMTFARHQAPGPLSPEGLSQAEVRVRHSNTDTFLTHKHSQQLLQVQGGAKQGIRGPLALGVTGSCCHGEEAGWGVVGARSSTVGPTLYGSRLGASLRAGKSLAGTPMLVW